MRKKMTLGLIMLCLLLLPVTAYGTTENSVPYITKSEKGKIHSAQLKIYNLYRELQPGEYFTLNLIGAQFDEDSSGKPRVYSSSVEFYKNSKTRVTGKLLDDVVDKEEININFQSKILADEAIVEVDGEDSHISSGSYTYAIDKDADISDKGKVSIDGPKFFREKIDLDPIVIKEKYTGAFRSLQMYDYQTEDLIKIELPKGEYEFYNKEYRYPITLVVEQVDGEESKYEVNADMELKLNPDRNILTFKQYNQDILQPISGTYTIRIENLRIEATNPLVEKDVHLSMSGKWLEDEKILIGKQVSHELMVETSKIQDLSEKEQKIRFSVQETRPGTLFTDGELTFGLSDRIEIDFTDDFKLKLIDGSEIVNQDKLKVEEEGSLFTIENYKRQSPHNLIEIQGEFTGIMPEKIEEDIRFLVSAPEIRQVFYYTLIEAKDIGDTQDLEESPDNDSKQQRVQFKEGSDLCQLGQETYRMDASPYISKHNRIMVPLRYVSYALGVDPTHLEWDGSTQMITLKGNKPMTINVKTKEMNQNYVINTLSEIELIGGRTFVPVGEIGKAFGVKVTWDGKSRTATFN